MVNVKRGNVTVKLRSSLNRIILSLIVAGMILGLVYSAVCDESYDALRGVCEYQNEINVPVLHDVADIIADRSADADHARLLTRGSNPVRHLLASLDNTGRSDFKTCGIISADLCIILFCVFFSTSFRHIFYIHLKDGNK